MSPQLVQHVQAFAVDVVRLGLWLVILTLIFLPLERLFALRKGGRRDISIDLAYFFLNGLAPAMIIAAPLSLLAAGLRQATPQAYGEAVAALPLWARICAGIVVSEIGAYWGHRWSHASPLLWRFHAIHHGPEHIDWLVNTHAHPVDVVFTRLCGLAPLYALGLAQPGVHGDAGMVPIYVSLIGTVWAFFIHANLRWRFGPLEAVVSTPAFHHWHHTNDEHRDHNYAALLPWVDRLFGTHHLPRHWPPVYGVDKPLPPTLSQQLLQPLALARAATPVVQPKDAQEA